MTGGKENLELCISDHFDFFTYFLTTYVLKSNEHANEVMDKPNKETVPCSIMEKSNTNSSKCIVVLETIDNGLETLSSNVLVVEETLTQNKSEEVVQKEDSRRTNSEMQTSAEENVPGSNQILKPRLHDKETLVEATHCFSSLKWSINL